MHSFGGRSPPVFADVELARLPAMFVYVLLGKATY